MSNVIKNRKKFRKKKSNTALSSNAVGIAGTQIFMILIVLPNVNNVIATFKKLCKLCIKCSLVSQFCWNMRQLTRTLEIHIFLPPKVVLESHFSVAPHSSKKKTIKHFTDKTATRDRRPIPIKQLNCTNYHSCGDS